MFHVICGHLFVEEALSALFVNVGVLKFIMMIDFIRVITILFFLLSGRISNA